MGVVGEVAALVVIALLALTGNALVAATLIRRSLLHHPSNRLVLSLTASNLLVVLAVVPGVIASVVMSGTTSTVPAPDFRSYKDSGTIESSVLPRALQENQLISPGSINPLKPLKSLKDAKPLALMKESKELEPLKTLRPLEPSKDSKPLEHLEIVKDSKPLEPLEDSKPLEDEEPLEPLKDPYPSARIDLPKPLSPLDIGSHMIHVNVTKTRWNKIKEGEGGNGRRKPLQGEEEEEDSPTVEGRKKEILGDDADVYCRAAAFVTNLVSAASSLTVAIIALDRYLAIVRPMMYGTLLTGARCLLLLACCWAHALLVALGPLFGWSRYERQEGEGWCRVTWAGYGGYAGVWVITVVLLPLSVMATCYYFILQVARNKCRRIHVGTMLRAVPPPSPSITSTTDNTTITANSNMTTMTTVDGSVSSTTAGGEGGGGGGGGGGAVYTIGTSSSISVTPASASSLTPGHLPGAVDYLYVTHPAGGGGGLGPPVVVSNGSVGNGNPAPATTASGAPGRGVANGAALCHGLTALLDQQTLTRSPLSRSASCVEKLSVLGGGCVGVGGGSVGGLSRSSKRYASSRGVSRTMSDGARSLSLHQNPTLAPRSCLKRSQSSVLPRPSFRHKLGLASRKPSWNWESSPAKGFRTVCVVVGAQLVTWLPFTALAVVEAIAGPRHSHILPYWTRACAVLLLYGSSVFYPIVYGLYNRSIRKELRACLCPHTSSKALRAAPRRLSGRHSTSGSLLDFSPHRIRRGSSERNTRPTGLHVSNSAPAAVLPALTPTLEVDLPLGVAPGLRKPSQDSGAIMVSCDDSDTDTEGSSITGQGYRYLRRGSAPCRLQSDPHGAAGGGSEFSYLLTQEDPGLPESTSQVVVAELHSLPLSYMDSPQEPRRGGGASVRREYVTTSFFGRRKTILSSLAESTKSLSQRTLTRSGSLDRLFDHVQRKDAPEEGVVAYKAGDRALYQALSLKRPPTGSSSKINSLVGGLDRRVSKRDSHSFYRRDRPYVSIPKDSGILEEPKEEEEEENEEEEEEEEHKRGRGREGGRVGVGKGSREWVVRYKVDPECEGHDSISRVTSTDSMGSTCRTSHVTFFTGTPPSGSLAEKVAGYRSKTQRQVSLDEGIGADCILEDLDSE